MTGFPLERVEYLDLALDVLADVSLNPVFPGDKLERERQAPAQAGAGEVGLLAEGEHHAALLLVDEIYRDAIYGDAAIPRHKAAGALVAETPERRALADRRARILGIHGRGAHDHVRAVGLQDVALVLADLVRAHEDRLVAALLGDQREADAGVAAGRLDDGAPGLEQALALGRIDHADGDAVLHGPAGIDVLDLGEHLGAALGNDARGDPAQPHERRVADEVEDGVVYLHPSTLPP